MVHKDLSFSVISSLKHNIMVYRSRFEQTLYVSTPFFPGATTPTLTQSFLGQIICAYEEALARSSTTSEHPQEGTPGAKVGDDSNDGTGYRDVGGGGPTSGAKR
jgi:hypothetical protein